MGKTEIKKVSEVGKGKREKRGVRKTGVKREG